MTPERDGRADEDTRDLAAEARAAASGQGTGSGPISTTLPRWFVLVARVRGVSYSVGVVAFLVGMVLVLAGIGPRGPLAVVAAVGFVLMVLGGLGMFWPGSPHVEQVPVLSPVRGRWAALNAPGSKVPSHGTHGHGQTWAIDLLHEPTEDARPAFGSGPGFRRPEDYPAFGEPVVAPVAGTVVVAHDGQRDHLCRASWAAVVYMMIESMVRELPGSRYVLGNHVVIRNADGVHALLAHLQRGSLAVGVGDTVEAGEVVARCGNSGNTSEPHVHFQLMESPRPLLAAGLPFRFTDVTPPVPSNSDVLEPREP